MQSTVYRRKTLKTKKNKSGKFTSEKQDNDTKQSIWNKNSTTITETKDAPKLKIYQPYVYPYIEIWIKGALLTDMSHDKIPIKFNLFHRLMIRLFFGLTIIQKEGKKNKEEK